MAADRPDRVVVVGASAGGVEPLKRMAQDLPRGLPAAVLVVLHITPAAPSALPGILDRAGALPAATAVDGEPLAPGRIYVAPPDRHLLLAGGLLRLTRGPTENGHRPAIDPLFRSAAESYGDRSIGVVLSGMLGDGSAGLSAIVAAGGGAVVQDPDDARYSSMPRHALHACPADAVVPSGRIAAAIAGLVGRPPGGSGPPPDEESGLLADPADPGGWPLPPGAPSGFTCPECGGALWEVPEGRTPRFRCRIGHAYSAQSLYAGNGVALEGALWTALRSLEERGALARRLEHNAMIADNRLSAATFRRSAEDAERRAGVIRAALVPAAEGDALDRTADPAGGR